MGREVGFCTGSIMGGVEGVYIRNRNGREAGVSIGSMMGRVLTVSMSNSKG